MLNNNQQPDNVGDDTNNNASINTTNTDDTDDTDDNIRLRNTMVKEDYFINLLLEDSVGSLTAEQFTADGMPIAEYLATGNRVVAVYNENRYAMGISYRNDCNIKIRFPHDNYTSPFIRLPAFSDKFFHYRDPLVQAICNIQSPFTCESFRFRKQGNHDVFFIRQTQKRRMYREIQCTPENDMEINGYVWYTNTDVWETVSHFNFGEYLENPSLIATRNPGLIPTQTNRENIDTLHREQQPHLNRNNEPLNRTEASTLGTIDIRAGGAFDNSGERMRRTQNNIPISRQEPVVQLYQQDDPLHLTTFIKVEQKSVLRKYLNSKLQTRSNIKIGSSTLFKVLVSPPKRRLDTLIRDELLGSQDYRVGTNDRVFKINKTPFCFGFLKFIYNIYQELSDKEKRFLGVEETFQLMNKPVSYRNVFKFQKKNKEIFLIIKTS